LRVLIVEDHELTRRGLVELLRDDGIEIAGEAGSLAVARALAPRLEFDVAVVDVHLGDGDAFELVAELRAARPGARVVMLSASDDADDVFRALRAGADGYVTKHASMTRIGESLRSLRRGEAVLTRELTFRLISEFRTVA